MIAASFLIRFVLFLQVTRTSIKYQMRLILGQITASALELSDLECQKFKT